jgi:hypothetical protein
MANKYLNDVGLRYYHERLKTIFATKDEMEDLEERIEGIISEGGEPNLINYIKVNGTRLTPDASKEVVLNVPTNTSDLTNDGNGTSNFATEAYVAQNGGKIDTISVNNTQQTITNKNVNITVPTAMSDLTNDGNYVTDASYVHTDTNYTSTDKGKVDKLVFNGTKIDESILPSYVDDVVEVYPVGQTELAANWFALTAGGAPITPESGKIYVLMADSTNYTANSQFRYGGSTYVKLSDGGVSAITTAEIDTIVTPTQGS